MLFSNQIFKLLHNYFESNLNRTVLSLNIHTQENIPAFSNSYSMKIFSTESDDCKILAIENLKKS